MRTRRGLGVLLLVGATMVLALGATRVSEALASAEFFRVKEVELEGARFMTLAEVRSLLALTAGASVWDDPDPAARRVRAHPLVENARIRRRLPATLVVEVEERAPVALFPRPVLAPVDRDGRGLPLDPARHRLDLPILQPVRESPGEDVPLTPSQVRLLADEVARLEEMDPATLATVSEVAVDGGGDVLMRLGEPMLTLRYRPPLSPARLREGLRVLKDARLRRAGDRLSSIDLRYDDQVVVRFQKTQAS